jgi:hypothetical protein
MNKRILFRAVAVVLTLGSSTAFAAAGDPQDEVNKQVGKLLGDAISKRVAGKVDEKTTPATVAGGDLNNIYGSLTNAPSKFTTATSTTDSKTDIYLGGYDRSVNKDIAIGIAVATGKFRSDVSGAGAGNTQATFDAVRPYLSYLITDNFFVVGNTGVLSLTGKSPTAGFYATATQSTLSFNGLKRFGDILLKGNISRIVTEIDFSSTTAAGVTTRSKSNSNATGLDLEGGYFFNPSLYGFAGATTSTSDDANTNSNAVNARIGFDYQIDKKSSVGLSYDTQIGDNSAPGTTAKSYSLSLSARLRF